MSRAGPGAVMSFGNISTHISILPCVELKARGRSVFFLSSDKMTSAGVGGVTDLFNSRFVWVEQWSGLHMFRDKFAADPWDFLPVLQHSQSQMFICPLLQTWAMKIAIRNGKKNLSLLSSVRKPLTIFIFYLGRCHENTILHLHSASGAIVGSVQFAIFTQLSQNLRRFHWVSPHIVTMAT